MDIWKILQLENSSFAYHFGSNISKYVPKYPYEENPTALYYGIKEPELLAYYDKLYQLLHYIPHRETFLLNYTSVVLAQ